MSLDTGFDAQVPSLPEPGGLTSSLGETFSAEPSTGTADFSIPIDTPNGPNDIGPRLALRYDGASGGGAFGLGFDLRLPRIQRSLARGAPRYDASDTLILEGSGELLVQPDGALTPVVDGGAWRIRAQGDGYRLTDRSGTIYTLGTTPEARLFDESTTDNPTGAAFDWRLESIEDALGNKAVFTWRREAGQVYPSSVEYGAYKVGFVYETRPDALRWTRAGFLVRTGLRCAAIELSLPRDDRPLLRRWTLGYARHALNSASLLSTVRLTGFDAGGGSVEVPPLTLGYSDAGARTLTRMKTLDDGIAPGALRRTAPRAELIDWFGSGLPDILEIAGGGSARAWPNLGDLTWGRPQSVGVLPLFSSPDAAVAFIDMTGDGLADLVRADRPLSGYVPRDRRGFLQPVRWTRAPPVTPSDPAARLSDADGDGRADLMVANGDTLAIYYRAEAEGWAPAPQIVPANDTPAARLGDPHVFLADMTGSGNLDLVRVDGAGVTYWPSLGRGRWADAVSMSDPPILPFDFRPAQAFLQDIDGDGCADLVYLDQGRATCWINQGGNGFSAARVIDYLPFGDIGQARWADMAGQGVNGLVWSAPVAGRVAYYFLDFVGGSKPYLLETIDNGCGLTTTIEYSTSAREAARDRASETPWSTAMPIVLPVVSATATRDLATGTQGRTEYRYHDGRYDGVLREFAGFGRVETLEIGDQTAPSLLTAAWFHNGLTLDGAEPSDLDERMARRAVRGRMYRQDRLSPDGSPQQDLPFDRTEQAWTSVASETPAGTSRRPRLLATTRTVFERAAEAATRHVTANTAWDASGNITESLETSEIVGVAGSLKSLRTHCDFAADPLGRFISLPARMRQIDGGGTIVADTVTEYDHSPEGSVGIQGLVTRRTALVLTDATVAEVYGAAAPEFAELGYFRRPGEGGWWITQAAYERTDDAGGLRGATADANGATSRYAFNDDRTFPVAVTDPMGNVTVAAYDPRVARPVRVTDAGGVAKSAAYDGLARLLYTIEPGDTADLPTVSLAYESAQIPLALIRRRRAVSGQTDASTRRDLFDGAGRLIERRESDAVGETVVVSQRFGARGFKARSWHAFQAPSPAYADPGLLAPSIAYAYDALGRPVRADAPDGSVRTTTYGPLLVEEADEEDNSPDRDATHRGTPTRKHLDATGRVVSVEENLAGRSITSRHVYDIKGALVAHTDAAGHTVRFWFDCLGRQLRVQRPERDTVVVRDAVGHAVETRPAGFPGVWRRFDAAGRMIAVRLGAADAAPIQQFTYQDSGAPPPPDAGTHTAGGRLVRVDDEAGVTVFDYDERGRRTRKRWRAAGSAAAYDLDTLYRATARVTAVVYPDGGGVRRRVEHVYDARGRLVGVPTVAPAIGVDPEGRMTSLSAQNGARLDVVYDGATGRIKSRVQTAPDGWRRAADYAWDRVGNLLVVDSVDQSLAARYVYDDLYRLTSAGTPLGETWDYRYADDGAVVFKSDVGAYRYGENGAPATCATSAGSQTLTYDAAGNVLSAPWGEQIFDSLGRLVRISRDGTTVASYVYDWSGRRVTATTADGQGGLSVRLTPDSHFAVDAGILSLNLYAGDLLVARQVVGGATTWLHFDHLGGLIATTNDAGGLVDTLRYDPYGRLLARTGAATAQPEGFAAGDYDAAFGLIYLQARYYHPALGIFVSVDPIVHDPMSPIAWSAYAYCGNNPASRADPSGLSFNLGKFIVGLVAVAALIGLAVVTAGLSAPAIAVVVFGAVSGGLIGGITVAREEGRNAELSDVLLGATIGAAVGGWASYATVYGPALYGNLTGQGIGQAYGLGNNVLTGLLNNAVTQIAAGFAHAVAKPIAGTGDFGSKFWADIAQSAISGAVSGAAQGALFGAFSARDLTDQQQDEVFEKQIREPFTGKLSPANMPFSARTASALIVSAEQVGTSQIDWHPNFFVGTAQNTGAGTGMDVAAGLFATSLLIVSF